MKKDTRLFIGTIAGALVGSAILNLDQVVSAIAISTTPQIANIIPLIGLILGGLIGYNVAKNS